MPEGCPLPACLGGPATLPGGAVADLPTARPHAFMSFLAAWSRATGQAWDYDDLMGFSGLAFRTRWPLTTPGTPCRPAAGDTTDAPTVLDALRRTIGWSLLADHDVPPSAMQERVVQAIDGGHTLALRLADRGRVVVHSHREQGRVLVGNAPAAAGAAWTGDVTQVRPPLIYLAPPPKGAAPATAVSAALATAVAAWEQERDDDGLGGWWCGDAAYAAWRRDLGRLSEAPREEATALLQLHALCLHRWRDARQAAVTFLRRYARTLAPAQRDCVEQAAGLYQESLAALVARVTAPTGDAAALPDRQQQAGALARAQALEAGAVEILRDLATRRPTPAPARGTSPGERGQALARTGSERVGDRVWLSGIDEPAHWHAAIEATCCVLRALGHQADYSYLLGVAGAAFGLPARLFAEAIDPATANDQVEAATAALGLQVTWLPAGVRREALAASIEAGRPLVCVGPVTGYVFGHEGGALWALCRPCGQGEASVHRFAPDDPTVALARLESGPRRPLDPRQLAVAALARAHRQTGGPARLETRWQEWVATLWGEGPAPPPTMAQARAAAARLWRFLSESRQAGAAYLAVAAYRLGPGRAAAVAAGRSCDALVRHLARCEDRLLRWLDAVGPVAMGARRAVARTLGEIAATDVEVANLLAAAAAAEELPSGPAA